MTVVEFVDYTRPFTARMEPTVKQVLTEEHGQVRFVVMHHWLPAHIPRITIVDRRFLEYVC